MDDIKSAITALDQLIAIRKAALAKAADSERVETSDGKTAEIVAKHKSALRTLNAARRLLVKHRKVQRQQMV